MSYSLDFRRQVFRIKERENLSFEQASERFGISARTLYRWQNRIEPVVHRNRRATKIDMEALAKDVAENPDHYQYERARRFGVSQSGMFAALKRLGVRVKKTLFHPKADVLSRLCFAEQRYRYQVLEQRPVVYMDESGFEVDASRQRGYSPVGQRCYGRKDWHGKGRVNVIGAVLDFKLIGVGLFEGPVNADVFYAWLTQVLVPRLPQRSVLVLDNATFHKRADAREAVEQAGHSLLFLPPYSPDLNPIEKKWAQLKSSRRKDNLNPQQLFSNNQLYKY